MKKGYASYIWSGWFGNHLPALWTIFALLMGFSSLASERATGIATYTLSLPTNRRRLLTVQATASAVQLSILALVSSLLVPALSPLIGQSYAVGDALLYAMLVIAGGMVLLAFAFLLSYRLGNEQVTGAIAWAVVGVLWALSLTEPLAPYSIFRMMGGESYFFQGTLPWAGLSISMIVAAALFSTTIRIAERQDF
jgi:ABC-type transport system involved in multi-copper enzyme maturation permease subunit